MMRTVARQVTALVPALFGRVLTGIGQSQSIVHLVGKLRCLYLVTFRKAYVKRQMSQRAGQCRQCGRCCALCFTCPVLGTGRFCLAYGSWRPAACTTVPIDNRDLSDIRLAGGECGFRFPGTETEALGASGERE